MQITYACLREAGKIELEQKDVTCSEYEVLIEIIACGICRGDLRAFLNAKSANDRFGHEPAGRVVAVGERVTRVSVGDIVSGTLYGSFATHVVAHENNLYHVPHSLGCNGCLMEPLKCVTSVIRAASPDFMDNAVVIGCGFMGLSAIAGMAHSGLRKLIAVDFVPLRLKLASKIGATDVVEPKTARAVVANLTESRGADTTIEFAGTAQAAALACQLTRKRGRVALGGGMSPAGNVYRASLTVNFVPPEFSSDEPDDFRRAIDAMMLEVFPLDRLITHRFKLSEIQSAFEIASSGDPSYLKGIVINDVTMSPKNS